MSPVRVFEVEKPNGAKEQRTIAQPDVRVHPDGRTSPLGPPGYTGCKPTPAREREMYILAGVDPDTHEPIGGLPIRPRP